MSIPRTKTEAACQACGYLAIAFAIIIPINGLLHPDSFAPAIMLLVAGLFLLAVAEVLFRLRSVIAYLRLVKMQ